jgi:O-antigen/teichoic acid export membrane protein
MFRTIAKNVTWNWIGFFVQAGVTFFLTPVVLGSLGGVRYGVWVLASSITGYYGLIDLGLRGGINQYLTRYVARGDFESLSRTVSTVTVILTLIGMLLMSVSLVLGLVVPHHIDLQETITHREIFWSMTLVGWGAGLELMLFPLMALHVAKQRYDTQNIATICGRVFSAIMIFVALQRGQGLIGVAAWSFAGNLLEYVLRAGLGWRLVPQLRISPKLFQWHHAREVANFGIWSFMIGVSQSLMMTTIPFLIAALLPGSNALRVAAVGHYSLANRLGKYFNDLLNQMGRVFYPAATDCHARQDLPRLRKLYYGGTRTMMLVVAVLGTIGWIWAEPFYRRWLGPEVIRGGPFPSVASLFQLIIIAMAATHFATTGRQVLLGTRKVSTLAYITLVESAATLLLMAILVWYFGLVGAVCAQIIPMVLVRSILIPWAVRRELNTDWRELVRGLIQPAMVAGCLALAIGRLPGLLQAEDWPMILFGGALSLLVAAPLVFVLGVNSKERQAIVRGLFRRKFGTIAKQAV